MRQTNDEKVRITWPWLLGVAVAGFGSERLVESLADSVWLGLVAFWASGTAVLLTFAFTRPARK